MTLKDRQIKDENHTEITGAEKGHDRFNFDWKWLPESGLSVKDFIAPVSYTHLELCLIEVLCHHFQRLTVFLIHGKKEKRQHHRHHAKCGKAQIPAGFE